MVRHSHAAVASLLADVGSRAHVRPRQAWVYGSTPPQWHYDRRTAREGGVVAQWFRAEGPSPGLDYDALCGNERRVSHTSLALRQGVVESSSKTF